MNPESQKIHGITPADLAACPRFSERIPEVQPLIETAPVLAWYATFDQGKLQSEFARAGASPGHCLKNWHCASILYHHLAFGHTIQTVNLQGACRFQRVPPTALHTALGDTQATRRVLLSALKSPRSAL